jgi:hypothetical protein
MGVDYYSGVILGISLSDIGFKAEKRTHRYEVHDKYGKPTGKWNTEFVWELKYKDQEKLIGTQKVYSEDIEEILNIIPPLELHINGYDDDFDADNVLIGTQLVGYSSDYDIVKEFKYKDDIEIVRNEIMKQFGIDIEPKMFHYFYSSC